MFCQTGWPKAKQLSPEMRKYFPMAAEFTVENNLLLRGNRIVIPPPLRQSLLSHIHDGHQGITKCRERARNSIWWPGISRVIEHLVNRCETCTKHRFSVHSLSSPHHSLSFPGSGWLQISSSGRNEPTSCSQTTTLAT